MKRDEWRRAYEPLPEGLERRVASTLARITEERPARKLTLRTAALVMALLLALGGVAYAILHSRTADIFGWFYGEQKREELLQGDILPVAQSRRLGDVVYTFDDAVYKDGFVYGTGTISPAEGANVVLIAEDYGVDQPAGYLLHYGTDEDIPDDYKSYADLAAERGARILLAKCVANGVVEPDGSLGAQSVGYTQLPQPDGSIRFTFEFSGWDTNDLGEGMEAPIDRAQSYDVSLHISNWEVTPEGEWLREEPRNTWRKEDWVVTVAPTTKEE